MKMTAGIIMVMVKPEYDLKKEEDCWNKADTKPTKQAYSGKHTDINMLVTHI